MAAFSGLSQEKIFNESDEVVVLYVTGGGRNREYSAEWAEVELLLRKPQ